MTGVRVEHTRTRRDPPHMAGMVPPNDLDAEAAVISACLLKAEAVEVARAIVQPVHCYSPANEWVLRAIFAVRDESRPVDVVTVATWLRDRERLGTVGGPAYLARVIDATPAIAHVEEHALAVVRKARVRSVISEAHQIAAEGYGDVGDEDQWVTESSRRIAAVGEDIFGMKGESEPLLEPTRRVFDRYLGLRAKPEDELVTTGFVDLDHLVSLDPGSLVVVGARSGRGKTSFATQAALHVGTHFGAALFFSGEMSAEQLALRALCSSARVDSKRVRRGLCSIDEGHLLTDAANRVRDAITWIADRPRVDVLAIQGIARREVRRIEQTSGQRVRLVVVDYLQRIRAGKAAPWGANREQQVAAIAFELKELARELGVCVMVPAQLNADADRRDDARPRASDLRESKGIENEADTVILLHNPHYLDRTENDGADPSEPEACEAIVGKGRNDGNGVAPLWFTPLYSRFDSMTDADKERQRELRPDRRGR